GRAFLMTVVCDLYVGGFCLAFYHQTVRSGQLFLLSRGKYCESALVLTTVQWNPFVVDSHGGPNHRDATLRHRFPLL
ncbi:hypothetical protein V5799_025103, partial [Amblyomma americanum]